MYFLVCHWFEPDVKIFAAVVDTLKSLYWHLFDEWEGPGISEAARMEVNHPGFLGEFLNSVHAARSLPGCEA